MSLRTRFAPSPTGPLHLGHAYAAIVAHDLAQAAGGAFLLRIEDIDQSRARPHWEAQIFEDLAWLGLSWAPAVWRQSERMQAYEDALDDLWALELLYPCHCNRKDILAAASAPQEGAPLLGPDGIVYPGTCRDHPRPKARPKDCALRLDAKAAFAGLTDPLAFAETGAGPDGQTGHITCTAETFKTTIGDVVLARRDMGTSYHLSVVVDDAAQEITLVTRGNDLFDATPIHVLLQHLMGLSSPEYHHHRLIRDAAGKRLAKRDDARAIAQFRADGETPEAVRQRIMPRPSSAP